MNNQRLVIVLVGLCVSVFSTVARMDLAFIYNKSSSPYRLAGGTIIRPYSFYSLKNKRLFAQKLSQVGFVGDKAIQSISFLPIGVCQKQCVLGQDLEYQYGGVIFGAQKLVDSCKGFVMMIEQATKRSVVPVSLCKTANMKGEVGLNIFDDHVEIVPVKNVFNIKIEQ